jgi:hypothetical protein
MEHGLQDHPLGEPRRESAHHHYFRENQSGTATVGTFTFSASSKSRAPSDMAAIDADG